MGAISPLLATQNLDPFLRRLNSMTEALSSYGRNTNHILLFVFSSVLCYYLHLPPAVLVSCCPQFVFEIYLPGILWSSSSYTAIRHPLKDMQENFFKQYYSVPTILSTFRSALGNGKREREKKQKRGYNPACTDHPKSGPATEEKQQTQLSNSSRAEPSILPLPHPTRRCLSFGSAS